MTLLVGVALFWSVSQIYLIAFPNYTKNTLFQFNTFYVQLTMAFSGLGVILDSLIAGRFFKNYIELGLVSLGALGIFITTLLTPYFQSLVVYAVIFFFF